MVFPLTAAKIVEQLNADCKIPVYDELFATFATFVKNTK